MMDNKILKQGSFVGMDEYMLNTMDKQYILVDVMVDITNNLTDKLEFRNKLTKWVKSNNWDLNGFIGEYKKEGEDE